MKTIQVAFVLLYSLDVISGNILSKQLQAPSDPGSDPGSDPVTAPIDNFTFVLLFAGIGLGAYLIQKRKVSLKR